MVPWRAPCGIHGSNVIALAIGAGREKHLDKASGTVSPDIVEIEDQR